MEEIDFTIDETDPEVLQASGNFTPLKAHRLLQRYLESSSDPDSLTRAAAEIHNMLCAHDGPTGEEKSNAEWEHTMFIHTLLDLVGKSPHSHRAQDDIVRLLVRLQSSTKLNVVVHDKQYGWQVYISLTYFYWVIRDRCCDYMFSPSTPEEKHFINESAFLARLSAAHMFRDASYAVVAMNDTLESCTSAENERYSAYIAAASMWIIYAGQWLFTEIVKSPRTISKGHEGMWRPGPLYTGSPLGLERWNFWRKAFEDACLNVQVSSESRALAEKAMNFMDAIESLNA